MAEAIRRDYEPLADVYETRWRGFNAAARDWIHARWPERLAADARVADLGCGVGGFLGELAPRHPGLTLFGLDMVPALLARARRTVPSALLAAGDAASPPVAPASFDVVCSLNILHHMAQPARHVAVLARIARPGGTVFLCSFAGGHGWRMRVADWWLRRTNPGWHGMLSPEALRAMLIAEPDLSIADQTQIKADAWWWLQIYRLVRVSPPPTGASQINDKERNAP